MLVIIKVVWVSCSTSGHGSFDGEKKEIIRRANFLTSKVATTPQKLLDEMPSVIGEQFQGECAIYSCSMTCAALANIAILYPKNKASNNTVIDITEKSVSISTSWMVLLLESSGMEMVELLDEA